jgi:hypothetical protein
VITTLKFYGAGFSGQYTLVVKKMYRAMESFVDGDWSIVNINGLTLIFCSICG